MASALASHLSQLNAAATWAGITAFVWYAFGTVPLAHRRFRTTGADDGADVELDLHRLVHRSGRHDLVVAAVPAADPDHLDDTGAWFTWGRWPSASALRKSSVPTPSPTLLLVVLGLMGVGGAIMRWLPLPIVMGMFGGSILAYVIRMVTATVEDVAVAGTAVGCYVIGKWIANPKIPPVGLAVVGGGIAVALAGTVGAKPVDWTMPALGIPDMTLSFSAVVVVSLPMVVLAMGLGNVQGIGILLAQGYRVPVNTVSTAVGVTSVVNAFVGGHPGDRGAHRGRDKGFVVWESATRPTGRISR